jgi:hypothetical protein
MQNVIGEARNQTVPNQVEQTTPPQLQQTPPPLQSQPYMASNEYPKPPESIIIIPRQWLCISLPHVVC